MLLLWLDFAIGTKFISTKHFIDDCFMLDLVYELVSTLMAFQEVFFNLYTHTRTFFVPWFHFSAVIFLFYFFPRRLT